MQTSVLAQIDLAQQIRHIAEGGLARSTDLCRLMQAAGSDKVGPRHNYTVVYDRLFGPFRSEALSLFELGLGTNKPGAPSTMGPAGVPGASLRAWREYFPNAQIHGADIDAEILFQEERIHTYWTDQRDPEAIRRLWQEVGDVSFDIMIDDGLHEASANFRFLLESFGKLKPGGLYVIEDVQMRDRPVMASLVGCMKHAVRSIFLAELAHPANSSDNRLVVLQRA